MGEVELVQLLEAVEALYRHYAVALEAQEAAEEIRDTGWMKIVRILNRNSNSLPQLWTARQVVDLGNLVLADIKLFEVLQPLQVLDGADSVVAEFEELQISKVVDVLNLGDFVGHKVKLSGGRS